MPRGGTIAIRTRSLTLDLNSMRCKTASSGSDFVSIEVVDTASQLGLAAGER